jgi:type I restriction enzyme M protein
VAALKLDESAYFWQYICYQLHNENVLKQLKSFSTGSVIPTIRKEDLLKLKLFVPTLEEQKSIMQGTLNAYFKLKETELELAKQMQGYKEDATRQFQSIRHTFRQYLSALKSNVIGTRKFILNNDGNPISLNMIYSRNLNQTFGEHLDSINNLIDDFNKLLSNDVELSSDTSEMNLLTLIKEAQGKFKNESQFIFEEIEFDASSYTDIDGNNILPIVRINVNDFNILFSNVIANAIKHGFKNSNKKNIIRMFVGLEEEMCVIEISNNGKPIPKDFTLKHLTTRGEKTTDSDGIGSGGADMKSIIDKHNGTMDIVNDESNEYPVNYIFKLPLIKPTI